MKQKLVLPTLTAFILTTALMLYIYNYAWVGNLMPPDALYIGILLIAVSSAMIGIGISQAVKWWKARKNN